MRVCEPVLVKIGMDRQFKTVLCAVVCSQKTSRSIKGGCQGEGNLGVPRVAVPMVPRYNELAEVCSLHRLFVFFPKR